MIGATLELLNDGAGVKNQEVDAGLGQNRQQVEQLLRPIVTGPQFYRKAAGHCAPQGPEQGWDPFGMAQQFAADGAAGGAAEGTAQVEIDMRDADLAQSSRRSGQQLRLMADQLCHQRHAARMRDQIV